MQSARGRRVIARRIIDVIATLCEALVVGSLIVNIVTTFANTLIRALTGQDFPWATDLWSILISIITFLGAAACFRRTPGMAYTALIDQAEGTRRQTIEACGLAIFLGTCLVTLLAFPKFFAGQSTQVLSVLEISSGYGAIWLGVGLVPLCLFTVEKLAALSGRAATTGLGAGLVIGLAVLGWRH